MSAVSTVASANTLPGVLPTTALISPSPYPASLHLSSPSDTLYAQTLHHLATSLAKLPHPSDDRIARLVTLCPRLPPTSTPAPSSSSTFPTPNLSAPQPSHRTPLSNKPQPLHVQLTTPSSTTSTLSTTSSSSTSPPISPLFPSITLSAAYTSLDRTLFHSHTYGSSPTDLLQSVHPSHNPPLLGPTPVSNGDSPHTGPIGIAATPYTTQDEVEEEQRTTHTTDVELVDKSPFAPHAPLDDRSQAALLALLRYTLQANRSPHLPTLLPLLLRSLLALPYFPWHTRPAVNAVSTSKERKDTSLHHLFLSSHACSPFACDLLTLLLHLSRVTSAVTINTAVLIVLRHLVLLHINTDHFLHPSSSLSPADRTFLTTSNYALQGLLFALGEQSLVHDHFTSRELFTLLLALLKAHPSPLFHALTLRALVALLSSKPSLFESDELTASLNPHIQSSSLTSYKRLASPSSSSQHYSTLILTHSLTLSLLCALHSPTLKPTTLAVYKDTLDLCLNSKADDDGIKVMVGCVDVCECIMRGMISLAAAYPDLIPVTIDTCRSILVTSRRLASHPKQRALRSLFTGAIGSIFLQELASVPYASSLTRSFVQSSLSSVMKEDDARENEGYQRQLVLLLDVVSMLGSEEVSGQVIGLVLQRFSGRSRYLYLIIPQLTSIAMQMESDKEVDSIVTLFINTYLNRTTSASAAAAAQAASSSSSLHAYTRVTSNDSLVVPQQFASVPPTFSHSNLAALHSQQGQAAASAVDPSQRLNMEEIPIALARMAQGLKDEGKRVQMMKRMLRLFSDLAYEAMNEQAKARTPAPPGGISRVDACGALLPTLASLLSPEFYQQHGNSVPNPAAHNGTGAPTAASLVLPSAFPFLQPPHTKPTPQELPVSILTPPPSSASLGQPMPYLSKPSMLSSQGFVGVRIYTSRESNVKWFRRCWYILTHFDFVNPRQVKPAWTAAVRAIAVHSPVLLIDNKRDYLTTELELEAKRFPLLSPVTQASMVKYVANLLPALYPELPQFTLPQLLYLASVYHLETLRVRNDQQHGFAPIFAYIADEDINKGGMGHAVSVLADSVFQLFVERVTGKDRDTVQTREDIERHTNFLLCKTCARYTAERNAASSMLKRLVARFPSVQWSSSCLTTLLTLFHRLNDSIDTQTALSPTTSLSLPFPMSPSSTGANTELELPESLALRQLVRNELARIANDWLNNAHYLVPQETLTVIQSYIQSSSASSQASLLQSPSQASMTPHAGISLTLKGGQFSQDIETGLSTLVATLGKKEQFLGEIRGLFLQWRYRREKEAKSSSHELPSAKEDDGFGAEISRYLITSGNDLLSEYRSLTCAECHPPSSTPPLSTLFASICQRVDTLILHTAALLVFSTLEPTVSVPVQDLLHLTCKMPAQLFISSALSSSVFAWDWILSSSRLMELPLLIEMKAAWGYTVDRQIGLFSGKRALQAGSKGGAGKGYSSALSSFVCERHPHVHCEPYSESASASSYDAIAPHIIWTRFLTIHFKYLQSFSRDIVNLLASMLHKAFARTELLSASPSSFGARFRLLNLGFMLIQGGSLEHRDKQLLRDRVYSVAFSWFYSRPGWYDVGSVTALKEDVSVILDVRRALQNEDKFWVVKSEQPVTYPQHAHTTSLSAYHPSHDPAAAAVLNPGEERLTRLSHHRDLLLFLLSHEIDRIVVWHNPGQLTGLQFTDQHLLSQRSINAGEWQQHTQTAWDIAPILSIRLSQRFSSQDAITTTLRALVKQHPEAVYDISDAVMYLVTEDNVRANAAELRNLVYWSPTSLTNALLMFNPPYCHHRMVMEYAVHTLYSHPVDQVVFYLAQIVQSLRNDHFHLLFDFLLKSSHFSILLSHQLIWLCQAELGEVKETGRPLEMTPFRRLCQSLLDTIIANFTAAERSYYRDEFAFFEQVTAISGILKPLPTKQERKAKIKVELEKVEVKRGLYLPTNPHLQVKEIICKSGTPMQSAAKVPILVAFMVAEGELDEDWIRDGGRENEIRKERHAAVKLVEDAQQREEEKADRQAKEERQVTRLYPVAVTAEEKKQEDVQQAAIFVRHPSESSLSRHVSPSSNHQEGVDEDSIIVTSPHQPTSSAPPTFPQACIFKVGDDCRQDALALQIIQWCKTIFQLHQLPLFLYPYRVLPNRTGEEGLIGGIIETRDEIGKATGSSLKQYFLSRYGREESSSYQRAQRNFIVSQAAYAITSYILQVKDRHNGNLMFDGAGHVIHIDFGFIFSISPAKNMRFEKPAFKLTAEMVELMGNSVDSPLYRWFQVLVVRGFLAVREHLHEIIAIVQPMLQSSLTCFRGDSLGELRERFFPDKSEQDAAEAMLTLIYKANGAIRTNVYDWIQNKQQGVYYYKNDHPEDE